LGNPTIKKIRRYRVPNTVQAQVRELRSPDILHVKTIVIVNVASQPEDTFVLPYQVNFVGREETVKQNAIGKRKAIAKQLRAPVIDAKGLAKGSPRLGVLANVIRLYASQGIQSKLNTFSRNVSPVFNLDEYAIRGVKVQIGNPNVGALTNNYRSDSHSGLFSGFSNCVSHCLPLLFHYVALLSVDKNLGGDSKKDQSVYQVGSYELDRIGNQSIEIATGDPQGRNNQTQNNEASGNPQGGNPKPSKNFLYLALGLFIAGTFAGVHLLLLAAGYYNCNTKTLDRE